MARGEIRRFIPDASVAVKWFVSEEDSERARVLKEAYIAGDVDLVSPRLLEYEVMNALRFHPMVKLGADELVRAVSALRGLGVMVEVSEGVWVGALGLSFLEGISVYDGVYLSLAERSGGRVVTSDASLVQRLSEKSRQNLILLKDLHLGG